VGTSSTLATSDKDYFNSALRPSDSNILCTGTGEFKAHVTRMSFRTLWLQKIYENLPRVMNAANSPTRAGFSFLTHPGEGIVWNGIQAAPDQIIPIPPARDFRHRLVGPTRWASMSLPVDSLGRLSGPAGRDLVPDGDELPIEPPAIRIAHLRTLLWRAEKVLASCPDVLAHPSGGIYLEGALTDALVSVLSTATPASDYPNRHRSLYVARRFVALVEERVHEALLLTDISQRLSVPIRTLHAVCLEHLGISPKRYLTLRRLQLVRRALVCGDHNKATVTDIATEFGFWELGRFAVAYKNCFGESPSVTLRRT
jgi:AraC-like DNA-binding protein